MPAKKVEPPVTVEDIKEMDYFSDVRTMEASEKKLAYMKAFAEAGDSAAQFELGELYLFGNDGVEMDWDKAKSLLYKASEDSNSNAMADLILLCMEQMGDVFEEADQKGQKEEEYMPRAMELLREAADNFAKALTHCNRIAFDVYTGNMKMNWNQGETRERLLEETKIALQTYLEEMKQKDDGWSNYVLGILTLRGIGVSKDFNQAKAYFMRGAEKGDFSCKQELKNLLFLLDDEDEDEE